MSNKYNKNKKNCSLGLWFEIPGPDEIGMGPKCTGVYENGVTCVFLIWFINMLHILSLKLIHMLISKSVLHACT